MMFYKIFMCLCGALCFGCAMIVAKHFIWMYNFTTKPTIKEFLFHWVVVFLSLFLLSIFFFYNLIKP